MGFSDNKLKEVILYRSLIAYQINFSFFVVLEQQESRCILRCGCIESANTIDGGMGVSGNWHCYHPPGIIANLFRKFTDPIDLRPSQHNHRVWLLFTATNYSRCDDCLYLLQHH